MKKHLNAHGKAVHEKPEVCIKYFGTDIADSSSPCNFMLEVPAIDKRKFPSPERCLHEGAVLPTDGKSDKEKHNCLDKVSGVNDDAVPEVTLLTIAKKFTDGSLDVTEAIVDIGYIAVLVMMDGVLIDRFVPDMQFRRLAINKACPQSLGVSHRSSLPLTRIGAQWSVLDWMCSTWTTTRSTLVTTWLLLRLRCPVTPRNLLRITASIKR